MAKATGAPVWCPEIEAGVIADINSYVPWPGFGPFEDYEADHLLKGGEKLELAGFDIDVIHTPGHSPGHVTFSIPDQHGDLLGRRPVPGLDRPGRPARRRPDGPHPDREHRHPDRDAPARDPRLPGAHGPDHARRRRCRRTPSSRRSRNSQEAARRSARREGPSTRCPGSRPCAAASSRPRPASWRTRATAASRRPIFEDTDLFARGVGESTEVVQKQMFTFEDQGGRSLTLRPEATAAICRAYIEHGMHTLPQPVKLWTRGPSSATSARRPGRFRQFTQVDAEAIGSDSPLVDAELIVLVWDLLSELGVPGVEPEPGQPRVAARPGLLPGRADRLPARSTRTRSPTRCAARMGLNPLRAFDSNDAGTRKVMEGAPRLLDALEGEDAEHFEAVRGLLDDAGRALRGGPDDGARARLLHAHRLRAPLRRARRAVPGRRRRALRRADRAARRRRRRPPAAGRSGSSGSRWRSARTSGPREVEVFIVAGDEQRERALALATELRRAGVSADLDLAERSSKGQMKQADRSGATRTRDPRGGRGRAARHGDRASSARSSGGERWRLDRRARRPPATTDRLPSPWANEFPALRPNDYRDAWCGQALPDRVDSEVRVAGWVHRRRDHGGLVFIDLRDRTGLVQLVFNPDEASAEAFELAPQAARRGRAHRGRQGREALPRDRQRGHADGRGRGAGRRGRAALGRRHAAVRDRVLLGRGQRGDPPEVPLPGPAPRPHARGDRAAPPGDAGDAGVPGRRGVPGDRDADPDPLDAGGRARLPGPEPPAAGQLLRAAAVAAAVQADADDRRLRALLPDRPLLPRRGPARRPPARLHPARHRDGVRGRRGRDRPERAHARRGAGRRRRRGRDRRCGAWTTTRRSRATAPTSPTCASASSWSRSPTSSGRASSRPSRARSTTARWSGRSTPEARRCRAGTWTGSSRTPRSWGRRGWSGPWSRRTAGALPWRSSSPTRRSRRRTRRWAPRRATCCCWSPTRRASPPRCSASCAGASASGWAWWIPTPTCSPGSSTGPW